MNTMKIRKGSEIHTIAGHLEVEHFNGCIVWCKSFIWQVVNDEVMELYDGELCLTLNEIAHKVKENIGRNVRVIWDDENPLVGR